MNFRAYMSFRLTSMIQWFSSIIPIFIFMILGGGLSLLISKNKTRR
ncbi:MAG: hypothetical protein JXQ68_04040 [Campylobacterales bacterium]|nr:hypothetical protein [Campylobacterales bacterium]